MTERTKTIKGLISGQVDMGTFGLLELELLTIEKEIEELKDWKRWFFEEQKRADDLRMELEYLKLTTKNK